MIIQRKKVHPSNFIASALLNNNVREVTLIILKTTFKICLLYLSRKAMWGDYDMWGDIFREHSGNSDNFSPTWSSLLDIRIKIVILIVLKPIYIYGVQWNHPKYEKQPIKIEYFQDSKIKYLWLYIIESSLHDYSICNSGLHISY